MATSEKGKKGHAPNDLICSNCLAHGGSDGAPKLLTCARCGLVLYCCRNCQKAHWKAGHKQHCIAKADRMVRHQMSADIHEDVTSSRKITGEMCAICLDSLSNASTCTLPCTHVFHNICVAELRKFGVKQACPLCRNSLLPGPEKSYEETVRRFVVVALMVERGDASWSDLPASAQQDVDATVAAWRAAADKGFAWSQFNLGMLFEGGRGVAQSDAEAARWFKKAARQGDSRAYCRLGFMFMDGRGVAQSYLEAVRWLKKGANQGHTEAQGELGAMYLEGRGVRKNVVEAARLFKKAADQGDATAQYAIGAMYSQGLGVLQSDKETARWYKKAAEQGDADAQGDLGAMYAEGRGVVMDIVESLRWFKKAAEQGDERSQYMLGLFSEIGYGITQSDAEAVRWYKKAADQGNAEALKKLQEHGS